jgi:uridine kinase
LNKHYIIGITGGSASGKTLFLKKLFEHFGKEEICLISQDNYYRPLDQQQKDENGVVNFDLPASIDHERFSADLHQLMQGKPVMLKEYTFNNTKNPVHQLIELKPCPIIVVEGIFAFYFPEISSKIQLRVFIDAKNKIKLNRRLLRDQQERGLDQDTIMYQWNQHVLPTYIKYIKPHKKNADVVIPNNVDFQKGLEMICVFLRHKMKELSPQP